MKRSLDDILNTIISESRSGEIPSDIREDQDFKELDQVWHLYDQLWSQESTDNASAWEAIEGRIKEDKTPARILSLYQRLAIAASFLLMVGLALHYLKPQDPYITHQALAADETVVLPDSSTIDLKQGSEVRYLRDELFVEEDRIVFLEGEAVFDVERDESRPFKVITNNTTVDVLGTEFSYLAKEEFSESENLSGLVKFFVNRDTSQQFLLNPGEKASYDGDSIRFTPAFVPEPPTPRNQIRIDDLVDILGDRFPVRLTYPQSMTFNGVVVAVDLRGDLEDILQDLEQNESVEIDFQSAGNGRYLLRSLRGLDQGLQADYTYDSYIIRKPYAQ